MDLHRTWQTLRKRFGVFFVIGAALSFANAVSSIQFILDGMNFLIDEIGAVTGWEGAIRAAAAALSAVLTWWRNLIGQVFGWIGIDLPSIIIDLGSAFSFIVARALARRADLRDRVKKLENEATQLAISEQFWEEMHGLSGTVDPLPARRIRERQQEYDAKRSEVAQELARIPRDLALTTGALTLVFATLYAIDFWYRHSQ